MRQTAFAVVLLLLAACRDGRGEPPAAESSPPATPVPEASPPVELLPGQSQDVELTSGAVDSYLLALEADVFVRIMVEQFDVDVVARLFDPQGDVLIRLDRLSSTRPEQIRWVSAAPGSYCLEISAWRPDAGGDYRVRFDESRPATERDRKGQIAELLFAEGDGLRREPDPDSRLEAETWLRQAADLWRGIDDRSRQADGLYLIASVQRRRDRRLAITTLETALSLLDAGADGGQMAEVLYKLGQLHYLEGEARRALELLTRALPLQQQAGHTRGEARTHSYLGLACKVLGDIPQALEHYRLALDLFRALKDPEQQARALHNLGKSYMSTGLLPEALDNLEQALDLRERLGTARDIASTLTAIGQVHVERGQLDRALDAQLRALTLSRQARNRGLEALALSDIALTYQALGRLEEALDLFEQAFGFFKDLGRRLDQAFTLHNIGWVLDALDQDARAADNYRQALALFEAIEHRQGRIMTLRAMALVERQSGDLALARRHLEMALAEIERLRTKPQSRTLRYSYFATKQSYYEDYVDLLMELHSRRPDAGHDAEALTASERARARSQLDALAESGADLKRGAEPELVEREKTLESEIASLEIHRQQLLEDGANQPRLAAVERRLRSLVFEHDRTQAKIRVASPRYAALTQPRPLTAADIQRQVVDPGTILLEYALGEERGYLWAVTPGEVRSFELPPREVIEKVARRAHKLLSSSRHLTTSKVPTELALEKLSRMLLRPVAGLLDDKRLLIVADGALQYIPFAALPAPLADADAASRPATEAPPPLGESHEIVSMPSASTLAVLRRQIGTRRRPPGTVTVFADPVFEREDPRFDEGSSDPSSSAVRGTTEPEPRRYDRLIYSRREADDIISLAAAESTFVATGFEATRDAVMSGLLADFRFLHFATHGVLNTAHPKFSRLVLSRFDREGHERDGFVYAHEVYKLELAADLVVLSACETALGAEIRGEGLLGLTQGFMYAGAASVLVSLWNVDDQATAELMAQFYRKLLVEDMRPVAALRAAQAAVRRQKRWQAPYFWAGFVLQGEWR